MANEPEPEKLRCPRCAAELRSDLAGGNCPHCLMQAAVLAEDSVASVTGRWTPPSLESIQAAFPQLEIIELVGSGGMGAVYKAKQKSLGRFVALKVLAPHYSDKPDFADRFAREAKVLAEVTHPHIVAVHDFGYSNPFYFLLMEYIDGVNLRQAMNTAKLTPEQALEIVPPICEALQFAHQRGIVHRDIKPENLLLDKFGTVKIVDFGIARLLKTSPVTDGTTADSAANETNPNASPLGDFPLTSTSVVGTPHYMAPEQFSAPNRVDHRADIYSLGVVLYEMLTGQLPGSRLVPPSQKVQIDVRLDAVVLRALDSKPEQRYSTASDFQESIQTLSTTVDFSRDKRTSKAQLPIQSTKCLVTNAEELQSIYGQLFLYRQTGQLHLAKDTLQLNRGTLQITIPLTSIQSVSLGLLPTAVNPYGLNFIEIRYLQAGQQEFVICVPNDRLIGPPSSFNQQVYRWWELIRQRVQEHTGQVPQSLRASELLNQRALRSSKLMAAGVLLLIALCVVGTQIAFQLNFRGGPPGGWIVGTIVFTGSMLITMTLISNRNNPDDPQFHSRMAAMKPIGVAKFRIGQIFFGLVIVFYMIYGTIGLVSFMRPTPAPPTRVVPAWPTLSPPIVPQLEAPPASTAPSGGERDVETGVTAPGESAV